MTPVMRSGCLMRGTGDAGSGDCEITSYPPPCDIIGARVMCQPVGVRSHCWLEFAASLHQMWVATMGVNPEP